MNEESVVPPNPEEARAALAEVDRVLTQTRLAIAQGPSAPLLILWGVIWMIADLTTQFYPPAMQWLWLLLDLVGIFGSWWLATRHRVQVKRPSGWGWRIGAFWGILFFYSSLWLWLLVPGHWPQTAQQWNDFWPMYKRISAYGHTIPMFAYVVGGLWLGRFFVWLGLLVTALVLIGFCYVPDYFFLWLAATGGGSLVISGVFIRKFWK